MQSKTSTTTPQRLLFKAACLLSLLYFHNSALGIADVQDPSTLKQDPASITQELSKEAPSVKDLRSTLSEPTLTTPTPEEMIGEEKEPTLSEFNKVQKSTLNDPRGFNSPLYTNTKTNSKKSKSSQTNTQTKASPTDTIPEPVERLRPELHNTIPKPWYKNFYIRGDIGEDTPKSVNGVRFKHNHMFSGGVGYKFNGAFRVDLNFQSRKFKSPRSPIVRQIKQDGIFLNGYLSLMDSGYFIPYLTAGIGYLDNKVKNFRETTQLGLIEISTVGKSVKNPAWNAGVGLILKLGSKVGIDIGYKFIDFNQVKCYNAFTVAGREKGKDLKRDLKSHEFAVGVLFNI